MDESVERCHQVRYAGINSQGQRIPERGEERVKTKDFGF